MTKDSGPPAARPQMRASHLKANVESLADLGPAAERAIRARCAEAIDTIEDAVRTAWLPLEVDVELTGAVDQVCGRERLHRWSRDAIARSAQGPLLGPFLKTLTALGLTPHAALRLAPKAWTTIYRHCGDLRYERVGEREALLLQTDAPPVMLDGEAYLHGIAGAFEGAVEVAGAPETRAAIETRPALRQVRYVCTWR